MRPLVSFVIPVRNDVLRLQRCLASIARNDYPRRLVEIIVVDNESTDGSAVAARTHGAVIIRSTGDSVAAHRNRGARAALGSIIAFADSDHEIDRNWIASAVDVLSASDVAATGAPYLTQPSPNWVQQQYDGLRSRPLRREEVSWLGSGNFAVKRAAFERVGGFNESLTACEDVDLCNRLRQAGYRIVADPDLRSIHFGDPKTLKALFFGELWRGRDNLRVTFAGPRTFQHLRSALIPIVDLLSLAAGVACLAMGYPWLGLTFLLLPMIPAAIKAAFIVKRQLRRSVTAAAQALAVAVVFDVARALALLARGSHRARRTA
ncbi:MAG TPA: glycosyltransferase [Vicinamibacterales bacterium]|nr:glycosyltransferase [Vicinamibacterales bacterium]